MNKSVGCLLVGAAWICPQLLAAEVPTITAHCTGVTDGDTIQVRVAEGPMEVDLYGIDAPEISQSFGLRALARLSELCHQKQLTLEVMETPDDAARVARVTVEGRDVSLEMLEEGLAWSLEGLSGDEGYGDVARQARAEDRGLWSEPDPVHPAVFRGDVVIEEGGGAGGAAQPASLSDVAKGVRLKKDERGRTAITAADAPPSVHGPIETTGDPLGVLGVRLLGYSMVITEHIGEIEGEGELVKVSWKVRLANSDLEPRDARVRLQFRNSRGDLLHEMTKSFTVPGSTEMKTFEGYDQLRTSTTSETFVLKAALVE